MTHRKRLTADDVMRMIFVPDGAISDDEELADDDPESAMCPDPLETDDEANGLNVEIEVRRIEIEDELEPPPSLQPGTIAWQSSKVMLDLTADDETIKDDIKIV